MAYPNMDLKIPRPRERNLLDSDELETPTTSEGKSYNTNVTENSDDRIVARMDVGPEDDSDRDSVGSIPFESIRVCPEITSTKLTAVAKSAPQVG